MKFPDVMLYVPSSKHLRYTWEVQKKLHKRESGGVCVREREGVCVTV
jgi:hypothetical protein